VCVGVRQFGMPWPLSPWAVFVVPGLEHADFLWFGAGNRTKTPKLAEGSLISDR
jgi:hypothetical protein